MCGFFPSTSLGQWDCMGASTTRILTETKHYYKHQQCHGIASSKASRTRFPTAFQHRLRLFSAFHPCPFLLLVVERRASAIGVPPFSGTTGLFFPLYHPLLFNGNFSAIKLQRLGWVGDRNENWQMTTARRTQIEFQPAHTHKHKAIGRHDTMT